VRTVFWDFSSIHVSLGIESVSERYGLRLHVRVLLRRKKSLGTSADGTGKQLASGPSGKHCCAVLCCAFSPSVAGT
jgi:hypothetical protein